MVVLPWLLLLGFIVIVARVILEGELAEAHEQRYVRPLTYDEKSAWGAFRTADRDKVFRLKEDRDNQIVLWEQKLDEIQTHTNAGVLRFICKARDYESVLDSQMDTLYEHLDRLWQTTHDLPEDVCSLFVGPGPKYSPGPLVGFLREFEAADPHLTFWFGWLPYRTFLMGDGVWASHVDIHNAKVEAEYPEDQWAGLKVHDYN